MARVLLEYNGRRVDIKDPVSNKAGRPDKSNDLRSMIDQALRVAGIQPTLGEMIGRKKGSVDDKRKNN